MTAKKVEINPNEKVAGFFSRYLLEAQKKFGKGVYAAPEHAKSHYGVTVPSLALQYLLTSTVIPMGRIICFSGPPKSGKSTLGYELLRIIMSAPGYGSLVETEFKTSNPLLESILKDLYPQLLYNQAETLDQAQDMVTFGLKFYEKECPANDIPMAFMLDSISGVKSAEMADKIDKEGHAEKAFPKEALMNTNYFATLSDRLMGKPINFLFINHEKDEMEGGGGGMHLTRNPGGDALEFHSTYHIRVTKMGSVDSKLQSGNIIKLTSKKNSMGEDKRQIIVEYRWNTYEKEGVTVQDTAFDWDRATADLLAGDDIPRSRTGDILVVTKKNRNEYSCKELDFRDGDPSELGKLINANEEIKGKLRPILGIFKNPEFGTK